MATKVDKHFLLLFCLILSFTLLGCGVLGPKNVELFQDKVKAVPVKSPSLVETEKQAAVFVKDQVNQARDAAIREHSSTNIILPLNSAKLVIEPLSLSLGAPKTHWEGEDAFGLALKIEVENAKLDKKIKDYSEKVNENVGKKIEGTGFFQFGYWTMWVGIIIFAFLAYIAIKIASIFYPVLNVGAAAIRVPATFATKALKEVIKGGETFKKKIDDTFEDENVKEKILEIFRESQERKQSPDVQNVIKKLTSGTEK